MLVKSKEDQYQRTMLSIGLRIAFIVLLTGWMVGCSRTGQTGSIPLIADIAVTSNHLIVVNGDSFVWNQVKITIDDKYSYEAYVLPRGKSSLPLTEFVDEKANRFKPHFLKIRKVKIHVPDARDGIEGHYRW
ncbi:hypothetical protein [Cohnella sp.]|uniref:hypothetical protein n=1 Tax=Cohnella sp. TaxID=1883426 RepID=UPI00356988CF